MNIWIVIFGSSKRVYYTEYHAEQMVRALRMNGTACSVFKPEVR